MMSVGEYFMSVVTSSVIAALVGMLYPDDKGGVKKTLEVCISLFLLCVIIAPIGSLISRAKADIDIGGLELELPDIDASADSAIFASLANAGREEIEKILHRSICERLDIAEDELWVNAKVSADGEGIVIEKVTVWLYGKAMWSDPRALQELVAEYTDAECMIANGG